jgi:hypothetical protein
MGRMEQLRQRMGCGAGKRYFFSGAFAIAEGKKCRHASYAKQTAFHLSHFSSSLLVINKKKTKAQKRSYIYHRYLYFSLSLQPDIFILHAIPPREFLDFQKPRIDPRIIALRQAVVLSSLIDQSAGHGVPSSSFCSWKQVIILLILLLTGRTGSPSPSHRAYSIMPLSLLHSSSSWTLEC